MLIVAESDIFVKGALRGASIQTFHPGSFPMSYETVNTLEKFGDKLARVSTAFLVMLMFVMVIITGLQVFCRYVLNSALSWPEEINVMLMAWITFVGSSIAIHNNSHMGVTFFLEKFPLAFQKVVRLISHCAILLFLIILTVVGYSVALDFTDVFSDALEIPMIYARMSLVIGGVLMLIQLVLIILKDICAFYKPAQGGRS